MFLSIPYGLPDGLLKNKLIFKSLTIREVEISRLISIGKTNKTHRNNIIKKLKIKNSADLVRISIENNIIFLQMSG